VSVLKDHRSMLARCAYCPKMCSSACPVSTATRNELHTPWGKMSAAFEHLEGTRPYDVEGGASPYACTSCGRCTIECSRGIDVAGALQAARCEAVDEGEAPRSIDEIREAFARSGNPYDEDLRARAREISSETEGRCYFPGCTALAREPSMVSAALDAAAGFGLRLALGEPASLCCGHALWAAGLRSEFVAHATEFARQVEGLSELVVGDPGCAVTLMRTYAEAGIELKPKIVLLIDLLAERVEYAFGRAPLSMNVSYHDACMLGRELGRYDGPRRLLRAAVGEFHEPAENREHAGCAGGGGLLPLTDPEAAVRIAAAEARAHGAPERRIVTGCPSACRSFRKAGVDALDLFTVLARWIAFRDDEDEH
jgi:Fe-S oxidoreductase